MSQPLVFVMPKELMQKSWTDGRNETFCPCAAIWKQLCGWKGWDDSRDIDWLFMCAADVLGVSWRDLEKLSCTNYCIDENADRIAHFRSWLAQYCPHVIVVEQPDEQALALPVPNFTPTQEPVPA